MVRRAETRFELPAGTISHYLSIWHAMACHADLLADYYETGNFYRCVMDCCPWSEPSLVRREIDRLLRTLDKGQGSRDVRRLVEADDVRILGAVPDLFYIA